MEDEKTIGSERPKAPTLLRLLLSSGLVAGLVGVFFSLLGLLYRAGFLSSFGIDAGAFLPSSPSELSYWGYIAIVYAWSRFKDMVESASFWYSLLAGAAIALVYFNARLAMEGRRLPGQARLRLRKLLKSRLAQGSIASAFALTFMLVSPWLAVGLSAAVIAFPLKGYEDGKRAGGQSIANYRKALAGEASRCHRLTGLHEPVGDCLLVIAQTTERIVFADGERVKIVPAAGVAISWTPSSLRDRVSD